VAFAGDVQHADGTWVSMHVQCAAVLLLLLLFLAVLSCAATQQLLCLLLQQLFNITTAA
jgi:hypothetical protein